MYLPKSQQKQEDAKEAPVTDQNGNEVEATDVIATSFGTFFPKPSKEDLLKGNFGNVQPLKIMSPRLEDLMEPIGLASKDKNVFYPTPSPEDYNQGELERYYVQDKRTNKIIEVNKQGYSKAKTQNVYRRLILNWVIKGPKEDYKFGDYLYPGVKSQNKNIVEQAEAIMPGISKHFDDFGQFCDDYIEGEEKPKTTTVNIEKKPEIRRKPSY
jgi:hypothetical protein